MLFKLAGQRADLGKHIPLTLNTNWQKCSMIHKDFFHCQNSKA